MDDVDDARERRWVFDRAATVIACTIVLAGYLPVAVRAYGFSDDYSLLGAAAFRHGAMNEQLSNARPLTGLLLEAVLSVWDTIGELRWWRLIGVIGVVVVAVAFAGVLRAAGAPRVFAGVAAGTACLLPPFQMYGLWATAFTFSWAAATSIIAWVLWCRRRPLARSLAFVLLVVALLLYQPAAMCCWAALGTYAAFRRASLRSLIHDLRDLAVLVVAAGVAALTIAMTWAWLADVKVKDRDAIVSTPTEAIDKVIWVITRPFVASARPFFIASPAKVIALLTAGPILAIVATGLWMRARGSTRERTIVTGVLLGVTILAMLPHVVLRESVFEFRFFPGIAATMWLYALIAARTLGERVQARPARVVGSILLGVAVSIAVVTVHANGQRTFVHPSQVKDAELRAQLATFEPSVDRSIGIVVGAWPRRPDLGNFSVRSDLSLHRVPADDVRLLLRERGIDTSGIDVEVVRSPDRAAPGAFIVDTRPIRPRL